MQQISGYVCLSRVKELSRISVLQSFSPLLFTQGPPTGPERLLRKLQRKITIYECFHEWSEDTNLATDRHTNATAQNPITAKLFCTNCYLNGESEYMLPSKAFGISIRKDFFPLYVSQGAWTRCLSCQGKTKISNMEPETSKISHTVHDTSTIANTEHEASPTDGIKNQSEHSDCSGMLCVVCFANQNWTSPLIPNSHGCSKCHKIFDSKHWSKDVLKHHRSRLKDHTRDLVCAECAKRVFQQENMMNLNATSAT